MSKLRSTFLIALASLLVITCFLRVGQCRVVMANRNPFKRVQPLMAEEFVYKADLERLYAAGPYKKALLVLEDMPGISQPQLLDVATVDLSDDTEVVGVEVDGEAIALQLDAMQTPETHIVNLMLGGKPVSVTYCDLVDCVRVLTSDHDDPIPLRLGGLDVSNQMVFLFEGERYGQESEHLPLTDHPFTRTTLGKWKHLHPGTRLYLGG